MIIYNMKVGQVQKNYPLFPFLEFAFNPFLERPYRPKTSTTVMEGKNGCFRPGTYRGQNFKFIHTYV